MDDDPRYLAMSPRERASFDALSGSSGGRTRRYNPNHGGWYKLDAEKFQAMRDYYTGGKMAVQPLQPRVIKVDLTVAPPRVFALGPGHIPKAICQTSSC